MCFYLISAYCIYKPFEYIHLIEGQAAALKYILSNNKCVVSFLKDDQFIAGTTRLSKIISSGCKVLEFTHVVPSDEGSYCLVAEGKKIAHTQLTIQRMLYK